MVVKPIQYGECVKQQLVYNQTLCLTFRTAVLIKNDGVFLKDLHTLQMSKTGSAFVI